MKNYHQLLSYFIKIITLASLPVLAIEPIVDPTKVQARLEYSNLKTLISDLKTKMQTFDSSQESASERKDELLSLLFNLKNYLYNLIKNHSLPSSSTIQLAIKLCTVLGERYESYSSTPTQDFNLQVFSVGLAYASRVLDRISQFFPFVTEESSSID